MIRSIYCTPNHQIKTDINQGEFILHLNGDGGLLWVDITGEDRATYKRLLEEIFHFHPLAVDDALEETHVSKLDDWTKYLYIVLHDIGIQGSGVHCQVLQYELDVFVGKGYLVTFHPSDAHSLENVWEFCRRDPSYMKRGAMYLFYHLADEIVNGHLPVFTQIEDAIDALEDQILHSPKPRTLESIFTLKRSLLNLRRVIIPQREVFYNLARGDYSIVSEQDHRFFRNIYDHYVRMHDLTENLRELLAGALQIYLSSTNNRMTQVVKTLTLITTIFMPLTLVTQFFGMNFFQIEFSMFTPLGRALFGVAVLLLITIYTVMVIWMRRRDWM